MNQSVIPLAAVLAGNTGPESAKRRRWEAEEPYIVDLLAYITARAKVSIAVRGRLPRR
jgi:hypothetical protein